MIRAIRRRLTGERGSGGISMLMLFGAVALFAVFGLVVDAGAKARAVDYASQVAYEAARAGVAAAGQSLTEDRTSVVKAATTYLTEHGATGRVTVGRTQVDVDATITTPTKVLRVIGITQWTITGHGSATLTYE